MDALSLRHRPVIGPAIEGEDRPGFKPELDGDCSIL
jgi:hypothetical protein